MYVLYTVGCKVYLPLNLHEHLPRAVLVLLPVSGADQ